MSNWTLSVSHIPADNANRETAGKIRSPSWRSNSGIAPLATSSYKSSAQHSSPNAHGLNLSMESTWSCYNLHWPRNQVRAADRIFQATYKSWRTIYHGQMRWRRICCRELTLDQNVHLTIATGVKRYSRQRTDLLYSLQLSNRPQLQSSCL